MWMIPLAHITGVVSCIFAVMWVVHNISPWWLLVWFIGHICGSLAVSVGLHRYFTHGSFKTNVLWHWILAIYSTLTVQGSALGWAAAHTTHHVHSDKVGDPHFTGWTYLLVKRYKDVPMVTWRLKHLIKDPAIIFTHKYGVVIIFMWIFTLLGLGGIELLVYGYLAPLGTTHLVGGIHQVISHRTGTAKNLPALEYILPAAGEWMHEHHHKYPRDPHLGGFDYGWWFIKLISTSKI